MRSSTGYNKGGYLPGGRTATIHLWECVLDKKTLTCRRTAWQHKLAALIRNGGCARVTHDTGQAKIVHKLSEGVSVVPLASVERHGVDFFKRINGGGKVYGIDEDGNVHDMEAS